MSPTVETVIVAEALGEVTAGASAPAGTDPAPVAAAGTGERALSIDVPSVLVRRVADTAVTSDGPGGHHRRPDSDDHLARPASGAISGVFGAGRHSHAGANDCHTGLSSGRAGRPRGRSELVRGSGRLLRNGRHWRPRSHTSGRGGEGVVAASTRSQHPR